MNYLFAQTRAKAKARLKELQPYLEEAEEIKRMLAAMDRAEASKDSAPKLKFAQRREQVTELLRAEPGARVIDVSRALGVTHARAGQIVKRLVEEGAIRKDGHRLFGSE